MQRYRRLAADTGLWLSVGGFQETGPDPQHLYNCHVLINSAGEIVESYRFGCGWGVGGWWRSVFFSAGVSRCEQARDSCSAW